MCYKIYNVYTEVIDIWLTLGSAVADPQEYSVYPYLFCMRNSSLIFHATYPLSVVRRFTFVWINSKTLFRERDGCVGLYPAAGTSLRAFQRKIEKWPGCIIHLLPSVVQLILSFGRWVDSSSADSSRNLTFQGERLGINTVSRLLISVSCQSEAKLSFISIIYIELSFKPLWRYILTGNNVVYFPTKFSFPARVFEF